MKCELWGQITSLQRAGYIPGNCLTSWVYSTTCVQYLYKSCYLSDQCCRTSCCACFHSGDPDQAVPFVLYTVLFSLTHRQPSAPVALSSAFVSDFLYQVLQCALHWLQLSQHFFAISFRNQQFSQK